MELIEHIEGMADDELESDETTYEKLLNRMFTIDDDLPLKTDIKNPIEFAKYHQIGYLIETENDVLVDEAELMYNLSKLVQIFSVSDQRAGRKEGFGAIESFNLGRMLKQFSYKESTESFKRITKKEKN